MWQQHLLQKLRALWQYQELKSCSLYNFHVLIASRRQCIRTSIIFCLLQTLIYYIKKYWDAASSPAFRTMREDTTEPVTPLLVSRSTWLPGIFPLKRKAKKAPNSTHTWKAIAKAYRALTSLWHRNCSDGKLPSPHSTFTRPILQLLPSSRPLPPAPPRANWLTYSSPAWLCLLGFLLPSHSCAEQEWFDFQCILKSNCFA